MTVAAVNGVAFASSPALVELIMIKNIDSIEVSRVGLNESTGNAFLCVSSIKFACEDFDSRLTTETGTVNENEGYLN